MLRGTILFLINVICSAIIFRLLEPSGANAFIGFIAILVIAVANHANGFLSGFDSRDNT